MGDWSRLQDAYGRATEVPALLSKLSIRNARVRSTALDTLWARTCHQGSVYTASLAAVSPLIERLATSTQPDRHRIIELLVGIAIGDQTNFLDGTHRPSGGRGLEGRCYRAVARSVALYRSLLADKDARVRAASAFAVAWFPDRSGRAKQDLRASVTRERNEAVRASMLISLGFLRDSDARAVFDEMCTRQTPVTKSAAALGLFYLDGKKTAESVRVALAAASTSKKLGRTQQPWNAGNLAAHAGAVVSKLPASKTRVAGHERADIASLEALPFRQANALAVRLTKELFPGKAPRQWNAMTPAQQLLLKTIVTAGVGTWRGELDVLLRARGLPWLDQLPRMTRAKRGRPKP